MHIHTFLILLVVILASNIMVLVLITSPRRSSMPLLPNTAILEVKPYSSNKAPIFRMGLFHSCATINEGEFSNTTCTSLQIPSRFNFSVLSMADIGALEVAIPYAAASLICIGLVLSGVFFVFMCVLVWRTIQSGTPHILWHWLTISLGMLGAFLPLSTCIMLFQLFSAIVTIFNKSQDHVKFTATRGSSFIFIILTYTVLFATVIGTAVLFFRKPSKPPVVTVVAPTPPPTPPPMLE